MKIDPPLSRAQQSQLSSGYGGHWQQQRLLAPQPFVVAASAEAVPVPFVVAAPAEAVPVAQRAHAPGVRPGICYRCGARGHFIRDCHSRHPRPGFD